MILLAKESSSNSLRAYLSNIRSMAAQLIHFEEQSSGQGKARSIFRFKCMILPCIANIAILELSRLCNLTCNIYRENIGGSSGQNMVHSKVPKSWQTSQMSRVQAGVSL